MRTALELCPAFDALTPRRQLRRRAGIPDSDRRPWNVAYADAEQRRRDGEARHRQQLAAKREEQSQANIRQRRPLGLPASTTYSPIPSMRAPWSPTGRSDFGAGTRSPLRQSSPAVELIRARSPGYASSRARESLHLSYVAIVVLTTSQPPSTSDSRARIMPAEHAVPLSNASPSTSIPKQKTELEPFDHRKNSPERLIRNEGRRASTVLHLRRPRGGKGRRAL